MKFYPINGKEVIYKLYYLLHKYVTTAQPFFSLPSRSVNTPAMISRETQQH